MPSNLVLVLLEPLLDVHEVGEEGALVARVDHPNDEQQLDQPIEVVPTSEKRKRFKFGDQVLVGLTEEWLDSCAIRSLLVRALTRSS